MPVYDANGFRVCNRNMIRLDPHQRSIFLVSLINSPVASTASTLIEKPQVTEGSQTWARNTLDLVIAQIGKEVA